MSARKDVFDSLVEFCQENLNDAYGVNTGEITPKNNPRAVMAYTATFCKARITDGKFAVYSPTKIVVEWMTANRSLPHQGKETFTSSTSALAFINENFA
jgi:hypothetical protein